VHFSLNSEQLQVATQIKSLGDFNDIMFLRYGGCKEKCTTRTNFIDNIQVDEKKTDDKNTHQYPSRYSSKYISDSSHIASAGFGRKKVPRGHSPRPRGASGFCKVNIHISTIPLISLIG
jgi:hypothetical protein